jgi:hypothetical protein
MISRNVIRRSLQTLAPVMFLLLCSSISALDLVDAPLRQSKPISFQNILSKAAIAVVGKQMGLIVEFDETVKEDRLSIELTDVTLEQALKIILQEKKLQARFMEEKTIIVFPDNEAKRKKYEQYELWPPKSDEKK